MPTTILLKGATYYNTNGLEGDDLKERIKSARSLNAKIKFIILRENKALIWEQWHSIAEDTLGCAVNRCSLKRVLSTLKDDPYSGIQKTNKTIRRKTTEGAMCHLYGTAEAVAIEINKYNAELERAEQVRVEKEQKSKDNRRVKRSSIYGKVRKINK